VCVGPRRISAHRVPCQLLVGASRISPLPGINDGTPPRPRTTRGCLGLLTGIVGRGSRGPRLAAIESHHPVPVALAGSGCPPRRPEPASILYRFFGPLLAIGGLAGVLALLLPPFFDMAVSLLRVP
jgi:hypothetical protein